MQQLYLVDLETSISRIVTANNAPSTTTIFTQRNMVYLLTLQIPNSVEIYVFNQTKLNFDKIQTFDNYSVENYVDVTQRMISLSFYE